MDIETSLQESINMRKELDCRILISELKNMIYEERFSLDDMESKLFTDNKVIMNHIIWIYLDPIDKTLHVYDSSEREEIEKAYRNMKEFYTIKKRDSIIIFNNNESHMEIPLKYYTNGIYDDKDIRSIKRLIVGSNEKDVDVYIYEYSIDNNVRYKIFNMDSYIYDSIEKIEFSVNSDMYVKNYNPELKLIWEYTKNKDTISYDLLRNWTIFPNEIIEKIEKMYKDKTKLEYSNNKFCGPIYIFSQHFILKFRLDCSRLYDYAELEDYNNENNIYILRSNIKDSTDIKYMYKSLEKKNSYDDVCSICIENFKTSYYYNNIKLKCSHRYHIFCIQCIANILDYNQHRCPLCREVIDWNNYPEISIKQYDEINIE